MENRIWYTFPNEQNYPNLSNTIWVQSNTFNMYDKLIKSSIDSFNNTIVWTEMWDLEDAESRLKEGHNLFLGVDAKGPLAHVWFEDNYLYNCYVNPRREHGYGEKFIKSCFNFVPFHTINLYCDEWNTRAQKFFEKVGFMKTNSYI